MRIFPSSRNERLYLDEEYYPYECPQKLSIIGIIARLMETVILHKTL